MIDVIKTTNPFSKIDDCLKIINNQSNEVAYNFGDILAENKSYTFSCWFKAGTNLNINIYISDKQSQSYPISTKWTKVVFTAMADINKSKKVLFSIPANTTLYAYEGMLELGNLPSDFKPNDKDIDNKVITLQTNFEIQQGQINSLIKETTIVDDYGKSTSLKDKYFETVATVDGMKISIGDILTSQDSMSSKMTALELTSDGLISSVKKAQETGDSAQTLAKQTASKFQWIVKSGSSATDFILTDRTAQLVADSINLKGLVTFKGLDSNTQSTINAATSNANSAKAYADTMQYYGYPYFKDLYIKGDTDKYYPVILFSGNQDRMRDIVVSRYYGSQAPAEWNGHPTAHGIALNLKIKCNFGGWGGADYKYFITDFTEQYGHVFAGCEWVADYMGYAIFLRGGGENGAYYRICSDQPLTTKISYNPQKEGCEPYYNGSKDLLGNSGETYKWYAPEPRVYSDAIAEQIANMYTDEVANKANDKINNLQVGGRNLLIGGKFDSYGDYNQITSQEGSKKIVTTWNSACRYHTITLANNGQAHKGTHTISGFIKVNGNIPTSKYIVGLASTYGDNLQENYYDTTTGYFRITQDYHGDEIWILHALTTRSSNTSDVVEFTNLKFEKGNKATDWSPAPEDKANQSIIDNWAKDSVVNGETVINGGYIKTNTIKTDQLAVDDIFATGSAVMYRINSQEINANRITSGLLSAERINAYGLSVLNKNTGQQTFNITNDGAVDIKGTVKSSNYNEGKTGWAINNDGTAEFNDIIARGSVITNDGGIVSSGGSGKNLILNSDTWSGIKTNHSSGITNSIENGVLKIVSTKGNGNWNLFRRKNVIEANLNEGDSFTFAIEIKSEDGMIPPQIYFKTNLGYFNLKGKVSSDYSWCYYTGVWKKADDILLHFGWCNAIGTYYIRKIKLEKGDVATPWSPAPEDKLKQVRFWAGSSYEKREEAPFIVYSDGSLKATQGEYSGLWTGDIQVGNISISDKKANAGNDALLTIQNGENGIKKVQLTDGLSSSFAQDVIVTNNTYSTMISLKQDGSAYLSKGLNVADKATLNSTSLIINNNTLTTTSSGGGFLFDNDLHVGSSNKSANLLIHGNTSTDNITIDNTLYFGDVLKFTKNANGINIDFI